MNKLSVKIPFSGFYNSSHDALFDDWLEQELDYLATEYNVQNDQLIVYSDCVMNSVDWRKAYEDYAKIYLDEFIAIFDELRPAPDNILLDAEFEALASPKFYNFSTDCIYAKIPISDLRKVSAQIPSEVWTEYVKKELAPRSGFIPFHSSDVTEWEDLSQWGEARLGMLLECYIIHFADKDINDLLCAWEVMEYRLGNDLIGEIIWKNASEDLRKLYDTLTTESE